jgi:uncharacterized protein (DUF983 family)
MFSVTPKWLKAASSSQIFNTFVMPITQLMSFIDICYSTFANKCPRCHAARVFESNNAYNFKNGLKMYKHCASCGLKYEREVGYFYGAMYISYAVQTIIVSVMWTLSLLWE